METLDQIERALQERLVPRGFSEEGMASLDGLIDELAGTVGTPPMDRPVRPWWLAVAAAIVIGAGIALVPEFEMNDSLPVIAGAVQENVSLISESEGVVSAVEDDRWIVDSDGRLLKAWNVQVVNEERFRDEQTGHDVRILNPRDELVLVPVSSF